MKCSWIQGEMKRIGENKKLGNLYYHLLNKEVKLNTATIKQLLTHCILYSMELAYTQH